MPFRFTVSDQKWGLPPGALQSRIGPKTVLKRFGPRLRRFGRCALGRFGPRLRRFVRRPKRIVGLLEGPAPAETFQTGPKRLGLRDTFLSRKPRRTDVAWRGSGG